MVDIVSRSKRSQMMAGIRGKDTKPELRVRRELHRRGYRFRLHRTDLPGKPDIYLPKFQTAIFVNGCFWHGHDCKHFKIPKTNPEFWRQKISQNQSRDIFIQESIERLGLRSITIWECATRLCEDQFRAKIDEVEDFFASLQR